MCVSTTICRQETKYTIKKAVQAILIKNVWIENIHPVFAADWSMNVAAKGDLIEIDFSLDLMYGEHRRGNCSDLTRTGHF